MNNNEYQSIKAISHSSIGWFEVSPKFFKAMLDKEIEQKPKKYFDFGDAFHCAVLQPSVFQNNYVVINGVVPSHEYHKAFCELMIKEKSPESAYSKIYKVDNKKQEDIKKEADKLYKTYSEYIDFLRNNQDKTFVDKESYVNIEMMKNSIAAHKFAGNLMFGDIELRTNYPDVEIYNELAIEFVWPKTASKCKSKIDKLIVNPIAKKVIIIDLKSTGKPIRNFGKSAKHYNYVRQLAFYTTAVVEYLKECGIDFSDWSIEWYIVATEGFGLYETRVYELNSEQVFESVKECSEIVGQITGHYELGEWDYPLGYYSGSGTEQLTLNEEEND